MLLTNEDRWDLNNILIFYIDQILERKIQHKVQRIKENIPILENIEREIELKTLESSDVIAMTTTGAAKYKELLSKVNSKIMIVEEAA